MTAAPLARFSPYLAGRDAALRAVAAEIVGLLDACGADEAATRSPSRARASDLMWLWTLGAYEVVRTMCQARGCFAARVHRPLAALKAELERVRVPNTKLERPRYDRRARGVPVGSDRAPELWAAEARDILVGDPADAVSARRLLASYTQALAELTEADVLRRHEDAYA